MALEQMRFPGRATISDAILGIPERAKISLRSSIPLLATLDSSKWQLAVNSAVEAFGAKYKVDEDKFAIDIGLNKSDAESLLSAATFTVAILSAHPEASAEHFVAGLQKAKLLDETIDNITTAISNFANFVVSQRVNLIEDFERGTLQNEVLPSLRRVETSIDIRFSVNDAGKVRAVPVVLLLLDTDAEGQIIWLQLSKLQVKHVVTELEKATTLLQKAENWIESKSVTDVTKVDQ